MSDIRIRIIDISEQLKEQTMFDNGEEIVTLEYTVDGCSIKSIPICVTKLKEKEKTMNDKIAIVVNVIRIVPDPFNDLFGNADKFIQQLVLTFWADKNDYTVKIDDIRKKIVDVYGYSEKAAAEFNVASIRVSEHHI